MTFDNLYILSLSMCMQNFITIFYSVRPFSLFQNGAWHSLNRRKMSVCNLLGYIWPSLCLDNVKSKVYANIYQNIPKGLRDRTSFTFFQNLNLGKTSTNRKWYLTISWATSCQYQSACKISSQYSIQFKRFSLFQNLELGKASADDKCHFAISSIQSLL